MSTTAAAELAMSLNYATLIVLALWRFVPWARAQPLVNVLWPLLAVHTARTVALQLYSAQANGLDISDSVRNQIVWGDQVGAVLALLTLVALWVRPSVVRLLGWALVTATVIDLGNALVQGIRHDLLADATDVSWLVLTFYVPTLWVSIALVAWLLATRHAELGTPTPRVLRADASAPEPRVEPRADATPR